MKSSVILINPRFPEAARVALVKRAADFLERSALQDHFFLLSSGTTRSLDQPDDFRWIALSREALLASARAVNARLKSGSEDRWLRLLPGFHVGGLSIELRAQLSGAEVVEGWEEKWDPARAYAFLVDRRITLVSLVPTQLHDWVSAGYRAPPSLRAALIGGGALSDRLLSSALALGWPVVPTYGMTECSSQVATGDLPSDRPSSQAGQAGALWLLEHVEARVSQDGVLELKSPALLTGTLDAIGWKDPKTNGWFRTEDRVELLREDQPGAGSGRLRLLPLGRVSQQVKVGGELVDLARLQRWIDELTSGQGVILAVEDERLGYGVHLVLEDLAGGREQVPWLLREFEKRCLPFERVRKVHWVPRLPRSELGKVRIEELRKLLGSS